MKYSLTHATPRNMRYACCQVCGFRYHIKDLTKVKDKWNRQYGLIVCKRDLEKANPQDRPKVVKEKLVGHTDLMNPEPETTYITNPLDDRVPGKPSNGAATTDTLDGSIVLRWDAPMNQGSSSITGYFIRYSIPQRFNYLTLTSNSLTNVPYYKDVLNASSVHVSYQVAAINGYGQGEFSDEFYYPTDDYADILIHGLIYLVTGDFDYITTGDGAPILPSGV